ncbi:MAG: tetratricopeptide repeat protein [Bacteroidales bacterium]|nr:tetratricopeptide repeat protein [Bacteroidales bacterium]
MVRRRHVLLIIWSFLLSYAGIGETPDTIEMRLQGSQGKARMELLNKLAERYREESPERAISMAKEALVLAREANIQEEEAKALFYLAEAAFNLNRIEESLKYYLLSAEVKKIVTGAESEEYARMIGDAGFCYFSLDRYQEAMDLYHQSLEISLNNGYEAQVASMYSNIGTIYVHWGEYGKAIGHNTLALEIDRRRSDSVLISIDMNNIGKIYEQWGKLDEAIVWYLESLEIARRVGNPSMIAVRLNNLGIVYKMQQRYEAALDYFQQALELERQEGNMVRIGRRLSYIGSTYLDMKNYPSALEYLNQALPLLAEMDLPADLARIYHAFGSYYLATGKFTQATGWFSKSLDLAYQYNLKPLQIGNLEGLTSSYEGGGDYRSALKTMRQMTGVRDSVFTRESNVRLAEFQARFENEKIRLENEVLKKDARIKRNWYIISGFIALTAVVILLAIILILRLRSRNLHQEREMAREKADRLQLELELKNKELAFKAMSIIQKNESVAGVLQGLEQAVKNGESVESLNQILESLRTTDRDISWKEFEVRFTQVHKEFYDKLNHRFSNLTPNERKLCAFLRLNMTTKDIAAITHQSVHSINVARTRLRKKLNLSNSDENLITFLINL